MNESYEFQIPVGDWSNDGHGRCDYYWIKSNRPVQYVRELYFELCKKYNASFDGYKYDAPCQNYDDRKIPKSWIEKIELTKEIESLQIQEEEDFYWMVTPDDFINLLLLWLQKNDSSLKLEIIQIPCFTFYGVDDKSRHISHIGYGLFSD